MRQYRIVYEVQGDPEGGAAFYRAASPEEAVQKWRQGREDPPEVTRVDDQGAANPPGRTSTGGLRSASGRPWDRQPFFTS